MTMPTPTKEFLFGLTSRVADGLNADEEAADHTHSITMGVDYGV